MSEGEKAPIGVVGVGWVGLVTAACFAELGHKVVARDIVAEKVESLRAGEGPIHRPRRSDRIAKNSERLTFTTDLGELLADSRLIFICVETPPTVSGDADLGAVQRAIEEVTAGEGADGRVVVMKSTVPSGTGETLRRRVGTSFAYVSCPEFLREGTAVAPFLDPGRVVIGAAEEDSAAADEVAAAYAATGGEMVRTDIASAEMIKLASNAFLATKISFINEIANVCEELGADVTEVAKGMGLDPRIGPRFLSAGLGWGGSCFPKDTVALKQLAGNSGYHFPLLSSALEVNELQKRRVVSKLTKHLGELEGKTIALLGLAFKPDTDDMREASSLVIAARLQGEGAAVRAYDPVATEAAAPLLPGVEMAASAEDALAGADGAVLVPEWPQFAELDWPRLADAMATALLVDGRNMLDAAQIRAVGFTFESIGRPSPAEVRS